MRAEVGNHENEWEENVHGGTKRSNNAHDVSFADARDPDTGYDACAHQDKDAPTFKEKSSNKYFKNENGVRHSQRRIDFELVVGLHVPIVTRPVSIRETRLRILALCANQPNNGMHIIREGHALASHCEAAHRSRPKPRRTLSNGETSR
jgi:hypothetical protein